MSFMLHALALLLSIPKTSSFFFFKYSNSTHFLFQTTKFHPINQVPIPTICYQPITSIPSHFKARHRQKAIRKGNNNSCHPWPSTFSGVHLDLSRWEEHVDATRWVALKIKCSKIHFVPWLRVSIPINLLRPNAQHPTPSSPTLPVCRVGPGLILISVSRLSQPAYLGKSHWNMHFASHV